MDSLRRLLPSPGGIAFEAAGRLGTFTAAARELDISQAAVSYAVRRLEQQFGAPLFQREHRRVELTERARASSSTSRSASRTSRDRPSGCVRPRPGAM